MVEIGIDAADAEAQLTSRRFIAKDERIVLSRQGAHHDERIGLGGRYQFRDSKRLGRWTVVSGMMDGGMRHQSGGHVAGAFVAALLSTNREKRRRHQDESAQVTNTTVWKPGGQ